MVTVADVEALNNKIEDLNFKRTKIDGQRDMYRKSLEEELRLYSEEFGVSFEGNTLEEIIQLFEKEAQDVRRRVEEEYELKNRVISLIQSGDIEGANKLLGVEPESTKIDVPVSEPPMQDVTDYQESNNTVPQVESSDTESIPASDLDALDDFEFGLDDADLGVGEEESGSPSGFDFNMGVDEGEFGSQPEFDSGAEEGNFNLSSPGQSVDSVPSGSGEIGDGDSDEVEIGAMDFLQFANQAALNQEKRQEAAKKADTSNVTASGIPGGFEDVDINAEPASIKFSGFKLEEEDSEDGTDSQEEGSVSMDDLLSGSKFDFK